MDEFGIGIILGGLVAFVATFFFCANLADMQLAEYGKKICPMVVQNKTYCAISSSMPSVIKYVEMEKAENELRNN